MTAPVLGKLYTITVDGKAVKNCIYRGNGWYQVPYGNTNGNTVDTMAWLTWAIMNGKAKAAKTWAASADLHNWYESGQVHGLFNKVAPVVIKTVVIAAVTYGIGSVIAGGVAGSTSTAADASTVDTSVGEDVITTEAPVAGGLPTVAETSLTAGGAAELTPVTLAGAAEAAGGVGTLLKAGTDLLGIATAVIAAKAKAKAKPVAAKAAAPKGGTAAAPSNIGTYIALAAATLGLLGLAAFAVQGA